MSTKIQTKYGTAKLRKDGYYLITSAKEGNNGKLLHRLIYEDHHGITLLPTTIVHHKNGDSTDNSIDNLVAMDNAEHSSLHKPSEETKRKMGECRIGIPRDNETRLKVSKKQNTTGYYRVIKHKQKRLKQGFSWRYQYYDENGKQRFISCVSIGKLKEKVLAKGLEWIEFGDDANESCNIW